MSDRTYGKRKMSAAEFSAAHATELAETEQVVSLELLASSFPEGAIPLSQLAAPNPAFNAWLEARAALPGNRLMFELKQYWLVRLMKAALDENSPEAYRELLEGWLIRLGVEPPEGVLAPLRRRRGAPLKVSTEQIYRIWLQNAQPSGRELAFEVYGADYIRKDAKQRKILRDRCLQAVRRYRAKVRDEKVPN